MKSWTEFHIGVVYYSGLTIALLIGVASLLYLKPLYYIKKITEKSGTLWIYNFMTTVLIAGLLGAMSVSFTNCDCSYACLLDSPSTTIQYGLLQVSTASMIYSIILGLWFIILIAIRMHKIRLTGLSAITKMVFVVLLIVGIVKIYSIFNP